MKVVGVIVVHATPAGEAVREHIEHLGSDVALHKRACRYMNALMRQGSTILELVQVLGTGEHRYVSLAQWADESAHDACLGIRYGAEHA